jgi:hypothetical protein
MTEYFQAADSSGVTYKAYSLPVVSVNLTELCANFLPFSGSYFILYKSVVFENYLDRRTAQATVNMGGFYANLLSDGASEKQDICYI